MIVRFTCPDSYDFLRTSPTIRPTKYLHFTVIYPTKYLDFSIAVSD